MRVFIKPPNFSAMAFLFLPFLIPGKSKGQNALQDAFRNVGYEVSAQGTVGDGNNPLWLSSNKHGLSSTSENNGYLRAAISHDARSDSARNWRIGYGIDLAAGVNMTSPFVVQQLYADFDWKMLRMSIGAKEYPLELKNNALSSGGQTFGINARPVPQVRIGIPEYCNISGRSKMVHIKGFFGYGMLTDGRFQKDYANPGALYARKALYHAKAGYLKIGNEERFPLTLEGGLEMACIFGGTSYNAQTWDGYSSAPIKMGHSFKDFVDAFFGMGGDATDEQGYANATGNTLGSWLLRAKWQGRDWYVAAYYDHFFEDHSQMFGQYGWRDGMIGIDIGLPHNRFVDNLVYEYLKTTYQSGPVYHDQTAEIPDQISGVDNYYNHNLYPGWQHWGQAIGNPLYVSPLYRDDGTLTFSSNRFKAHHVGVSGSPVAGLQYRLLYTHERSLGTYANPFYEARTTNSFLIEANYAFQEKAKSRSKGWGIGLAVGIDRGDLLGDNFGVQLTLKKTGILGKR